MQFDPWRTGLELGVLALEAQAVVTMRMLGMAGMWPVAGSENKRMLAEKPPALVKAATAAAASAIKGASVDEVLSVATKSLTTKARANRKRLARRVVG